MKKRFQVLMLVAVLGFSGATGAAPTGTLTFITPSGTVGPTDVIDVWVRLALDSGSEPLQLDSTLPGLGVNPADVPAEWVSLTDAYTITGFACSGTFTNSCISGPPYDFSFNTIGPDSFNFLRDITINPGESRDYLFGSFAPSAGPVAPGTYAFYNTNFILALIGMTPQLDENGDPVLDVNGDPVLVQNERHLTIAQTCPGEVGDCAFTRTVNAVVPLPAAVWLFGSGLLGLIGIARRKAGGRAP